MADDQGRLRWMIADAGMAGLLVFLSTLTYLASLGFYSDDWSFLSTLVFAPEQTVGVLTSHQMDTNPNLALRPTQALYNAVLFRSFGLEPLGYHLVNALVLALVSALLYLVFRRLGAPRYLAFPFAVVALVLPNAATNRFWFASFSYNLTLALAAGSILADLTWVRASGTRVVLLKSIALVLLGGAALGNEVVLPLLIVTPVGLWWFGRRSLPRGLAGRFGTAGASVLLASNLLVLAAVLAHKSRFDSGRVLDPSIISGVAIRAPWVDFGVHLVMQPLDAVWALSRIGPAQAVVAFTIAALFGAYLWRLTPSSEATAEDPELWLDTRTWSKLALAGLSLYGLGYAIFAVSSRVAITPTGNANRVAAVAAIGVAVVVVSLLGLAAGAAPRLRIVYTSTLVAIAAGSLLTVTFLGQQWAQSRVLQDEVLRAITTEVPEPPEGAVIILAGVCAYEGAAVVFESDWDLAGALQLAYSRPDLRADVTRDIRVTDDSVITRTYGNETSYPLGESLYLWEPGGELVVLHERTEALAQLGDHASHPACPPGRPGRGALERPGDRLAKGLAAAIRQLLPAQ